MLSSIFYFALFAVAFCNQDFALRQGICNAVCDPAGSKTSVLPQVGTALSGLYAALISTVDPNSNTKAVGSGPLKRQDTVVGFCCAREGQCYLLEEYSIPFCYDEFTTNYQFPDGSYGSIVTGLFHSASGLSVDLVYGAYNGTDGMEQNIYSSATKPDTTTMLMPTPWTSSGIGTAIPASELGSIATITTTSSAAVVTAITLPSLTITAGSSECHKCMSDHSSTLTGPGIPIVTANASATGTATASASGSGRGSSIIIPPISSNWAEAYINLLPQLVVIIAMVVVPMLHF